MNFFENKKKKITLAKRGTTHSKGSTLVESNASRISDTPPVNVPALATKYAGAAFIKNGEIKSAPRKSGKSQIRILVLEMPTPLEKSNSEITVEKIMPTNIIALREWVKNMAADKMVLVAMKGAKENLSLCKNR